MSAVLRMEAGKVLRLVSVRGSLILLLVFPALWAYAPGIFEVYGFYLVSGFQVPALSLLSSMEFLMPLLIAIAAAELVGMEKMHGTLPTVLLRPVTRSQWLLAKVLVMCLYPFAIMAFLMLVSLLAGIPFGYGDFVGGTGVGAGGLIGEGTLRAGTAVGEIAGAYALAATSLLPVALLAVLATVVTMNAAAGALATLAVLIVMQLLVVFPSLGPFLLTQHLSAYADPSVNVVRVLTLIALYAVLFATASVLLFERKDV